MTAETLFRSRLLKKLHKALTNTHLFVAAPPGYGKTILLRQMAAYRPHSYYFLLTADDSDTAVLQQRLHPFQQPGHTLLLDDIHHLTEAETAVTWLVEQLADTGCRYVISGRFIPEELEIALTKGQADRWDETDLRFAPTESEALFTAEPNLGQIGSDWHEQLEGWPLGLALLARLPGTRQTKKLAQRQLFTYLAQELFNRLPADLYHFMRVTAVPIQFDDALAAHLLDSADVTSLRQEIQRRNLFLYEDEQPGHFRYHDLIRDYLLTSVQFDPLPYRHKTIAWFEAQDNLPQAIEHALEEIALHEEAARLITLVPTAYIYETDRYLTYRRWVEVLDEPIRARQPKLLFLLGHFLNFLEKHKTLARAYVTKALAAAQAEGNRLIALQARWQLAVFDQEESGPSEALLAELAELAAEPEIALYASRTYAHVLTDDGRFFQAAAAWRRVAHLAAERNEPDQVWAVRRTMALTALLPLGRFTQAEAAFSGALRFFADEPGWRYETLQNSSELHLARAAWDALAAALQEIDQLERAVETAPVHNLIWTNYYRGLLAVGRGRFADASRHLDTMSTHFNPGDRRCEIPLARARSWLLRRQGQLAQAVAHAEAELAKPPVFPHYRALLALERDIAAGLLFLDGERPDFTLRPETISLIGMKARPDLVRLRALLALVCHRQANSRWPNDRWQRHFQAALYALKLPHYERLLTDRDPELGGRFWQMAIIEGVAAAQAGAALQRLNQPDLLYPLLTHQETAVRLRAAHILGQMGHEAAMPHLSQAVSREKDEGTKSVLTAVLTHLETLPPPLMQVQLLGDFHLTRDDRPVADSDWPRPITRRLAQYFALHRGVALPRDQILDDLWPDLPPAKAWSNFRTVYSQLRRVVEPYMRPKVASRYFSLEGERYLFDPGGYVTVDVVEFETAVRHALAAAADHALPPLPVDLLTSLENYRPLLPELAYEEWLLAARERLQTTYIEGCLYVARGQLSYGRPAAAVVWAQRAVAQAPWLEEGYRVLMRAYARQDKRSLALKTYQEAVRALQQELDTEPTPLTQWLLTRLQQGEEI